jgi:Pentapeptide repeats (8 copies)
MCKIRIPEDRLDWLEALAELRHETDDATRREEKRMNAVGTIQVKGTRRLVKAEDADLSGSSFTDVNLSGATFKNVNFSGAQFEDANLAGWSVRNVNLAGLKMNDADLRGASIVGSLTSGMTIDGIAVAELMAAYRALTTKTE